MDKITLAYLAGFIDGEGCITILRRFKKNKSKNYNYYAVISVGQKDGEIMDILKDNFKGNIHHVKRDGSYIWTATDKMASDCIRQLLPFLRYKKPQAEIALQLYDPTIIRKKFNTISPEELQKRELLYEEIRRLKRVFKSPRYTGTTTERDDS